MQREGCGRLQISPPYRHLKLPLSIANYGPFYFARSSKVMRTQRRTPRRFFLGASRAVPRRRSNRSLSLDQPIQNEAGNKLLTIMSTIHTIAGRMES